MLTKDHTVVIVGAGLAGAKAAETLREEGFPGRVVLIGEETERPYERPPLSKGLLLGSAERDTVYVHPEGWYAEHDIDLRTGTRVVDVDRSARQVRLADGERIGYDKLLLATGSSPRRLDVPGADLDGVLYLRALTDSDRIGGALTDGARIVVVGGGWIGLEIAAAARQRGAHVTVVEAAELPLLRVLGPQVAQLFADLHRRHGVVFHVNSGVREIRGDRRVTSVVLTDGTELPADAVVVGVGVQPNVDLAERAGLQVDNGIVVDASLRTSDPDIYAAGDVANAYHPLLERRVRVEHWANALDGGPAAARAILGQQVSYDRLPYFYTDQYELGMEYVGHVEPDGYDTVVFRGDPTAGDNPEFIAFWLSGDRVLAGMNVNVWDVVDQIRPLVRAGHSGKPVDVAKLRDPAVPLGDLV